MNSKKKNPGTLHGSPEHLFNFSSHGDPTSPGVLILDESHQFRSISINSETSREMSERVQSLARDVYAEFEKLMQKYDEKVVEELMPMVVNVLEVLETTHVENEEHKAEVELLREDNEQLILQYEKEKELRKQLDRKNIETEDGFEDEKRKQQEKLETLETIVRMLELKSKNSVDQVARLEEKEKEAKKEYEKLHDRYSQLFKTHLDQLEKGRILQGDDSSFDDFSSRNTRTIPDSQWDPKAGLEPMDEILMSGSDERMSRQVSSGSQNQVLRSISATSYPEMSMDSDEMEPSDHIDKKQQEGSDTESEAGTTEAERSKTADRIEAEIANGRFPFAIKKEIDELIRENDDLLATKNALNVVKDDLIAQVDELSSEKDMLREEVESLQAVKTKLKERVVYLEDNLKRMREYYEKKLAEATEVEENLPYGQQKRFTRMEMARMVQEKNKFKEQLMELQDEMRAKLNFQNRPAVPPRRSRSSVWKFFGNLFGSSRSRDGSTVRYASDPTSATISPPQSTASRSPPPPDSMDSSQIVDLQENPMTGSGDHVSGSTARQDRAGRMKAYGWSIPVDTPGSKPVTVPLPVYCRPLLEKDPDMKIWCAVGVNLSDKPAQLGNEAGSSRTSSASDVSVDEPTPMQKKLKEFEKTEGSPSVPVESCIWICSSTHSAGKVSIIDANKPNDVLEAFNVCSSHLLCISAVPGVQVADYPTAGEIETLRRSSVVVSTAPESQAVTRSSAASTPDLGRILFVSCATGSAPPAEAMTDNGDEASKNESSSLDQELSGGTITAHSYTGQSVWIGSQKGGLYIYSADRRNRRRLHKLTLPDAVLCIVHIRGRVFSSLADGTVAVFHRAKEGYWDIWNYHLLNLGQPDHAIRSMVAVNDSIWCGCKNKVHVVDPVSLEIKNTFEAHSRQDSAIRQMLCVGEGVWISIRLDSTLRLFNRDTHQHLQDLQVEPLSAVMTGKGRLGLSLVRITAMASSCLRLWIGTSTGVVISLPFVKDLEPTALPVSRIGSKELFIPFCNPSLAQVSYHGHKEEVKFFVSVPGGFDKSVRRSSANTSSSTGGSEKSSPVHLPQTAMTLLMSGGEGYTDFRFEESDIVDENDSRSGDPKRQSLQTPNRTDRSHLTVWQVPASPSTDRGASSTATQ